MDKPTEDFIMNEANDKIKYILDQNRKLITKITAPNYEEVIYLKRVANDNIELLEGLEAYMRESEELRSILQEIHNVYTSDKKGLKK